MNNRAMEFLSEAYSLLEYPIGNSDRARLLVRLAIGEVEELLDRRAALEAQRMTPARLTESRMAALPGNGKGL